MKCDFCRDHKADFFIIQTSERIWTACQDCTTLIRDDDRGGLVESALSVALREQLPVRAHKIATETRNAIEQSQASFWAGWDQNAASRAELSPGSPGSVDRAPLQSDGGRAATPRTTKVRRARGAK